MTPDRLKAARKLLGWSRDRLASAANVSAWTLASFENGDARQSMTPEKLAAVRFALEGAGIDVTDLNKSASNLPRSERMAPDQVRSARRLLGWTRDRLAEVSRVPEAAISDFERGAVSKAMRPERLAAIRAALEASGVVFVEETRAAPGVRLKATEQ